MAISYPIILPAQGFQSISVSASDMVALQASPFTGQQQVQAHQGQLWRFNVSYPPMKQSGYADDVTAALTSLRGQYGTFLLGDSSRKTPRGSALLSTSTFPGPYVYGGGQTGLSLVTGPWAASTASALKAGDYFQIGGTNLLLRSVDFSDATWFKANFTVVATNVTAPDTSSTATTLSSTAAGDAGTSQAWTNVRKGAYHTFSIWAKVPSGTFATFVSINDEYTTTSQAVTLTTTWQRFTVTAKCYGGSCSVVVFGAGSFSTMGTQVTIWGAQLNPGTDADACTPTTAVAVEQTAYLHKVVADASSNGSSLATLEIWPRLRASPADRTYLKLVNPRGTFRLASNERSWDVDAAKIYGVSFSAVEAI